MQFESELSPMHHSAPQSGNSSQNNSTNIASSGVVLLNKRGQLMEQPASSGVRLDVRNVSYSVTIKGKEKQLLRNVNFQLEPGEMCALMGPSGAGKSTLLDLIADRKLDGKWSGDIFVDRRERSIYFNRDSSYVLQDDVHIATLTVEETLKFAAQFRMVEGTTDRQIDERVNYLLETVGLTHVRKSVVGDQFTKGISGGQLKRLSIAVEIVALPGLIFLDEPTSGLDSSIALEVMGAVKNMSSQGRTVVSTIHQPSIDVFSMFDKVILLSAGRLIFSGSSASAIKHFTQPDMGYTLIKDQNPAEFILGICGGEVYPNNQNAPRKPEELEGLFLKSPHYQRPADPSLFQNVSPAATTHTRRHATSKWTSFKTNLRRGWLSQIRDRVGLATHVIKALVIGVVVGVVFYGQGHADVPLYVMYVPTSSVQNVNAMIFFAMLFCFMTNATAITDLCNMNTLYRRELASFAYACSPYWLSHCLTAIPILIANHLLFCVLIYFISGLPPAAFLYFVIILQLCNFFSYYLAMLIAAVTENAQAALSVFPDMIVVLSMFSGFQISLTDVPQMWIWATYIDPFRWAFEALAVNNWEIYDQTDDTPGGGNGYDVLVSLGFDNYNKANSIWIMLLMNGFITILTYVAMRPKISKLIKTSSPIVTESKVDTLNIGRAELKDKLIPGDSLHNNPHNNNGDLPEDFGRKSTFDVEWYRAQTGDVTQSKGCKLAFKSLTYSIPDPLDKKKKKLLLNDVSGRINPGEMCALMGASGAGKSTLLDVIAGRKTVGTIQGDILFNGSPRSPAVMLLSAYVMQDNVHIASLTVGETLMYAAHLRLPQKQSRELKGKRVKKILDMLGLTDHEHTLVGDENTKGLSGGQVKRLSIGVEIVHLPDLIFLDEPTTGLDSSISYDVMAAVRNLANQNRTVLCTIHQPSARVYSLFDKLLLMAQGKVIYFGPSRDIVNYFTTSPYQFPFEQNGNAAEYLIAVAGSFLPASDGKKISGEELAAYFNRHDMNRIFLENLDKSIELDKTAAANNQLLSTGPVSAYPTTTAYQTYVLCHRVAVKTWKDPSLVILTLVKQTAISLFFGTLYFHLESGAGSNDPTVYTNRISLLFFCQMSALGWHQQNIPLFFSQRTQFYRERAANLYGALPYWFSSFIWDIPLETLYTLIFSAIAYHMAGLNSEEGKFTLFFFVSLLNSWTGLFFAQLIAAAMPTQLAAVAFFPVALFVNITFSGYIVYLPSLADYLSYWGPYLSFMRYSFQVFVRNELVDNNNLPYGPDYVTALGFDDLSTATCVVMTALFLVIYAIVTLLVMKYVNYENR